MIKKFKKGGHRVTPILLFKFSISWKVYEVSNEVNTENKMLDYILLNDSTDEIHTCLGTPILADLKNM